MIDHWIKNCYKENQFQLWMLNCLNEDQFNNLITKKQTQKLDIELQQKTINQIIAKDAKWAYWYADNVLHGPFSAGEPAIATSAYWSYWYSFNILQGPFPAGESIIATDVEESYYYALNVLDEPFPIGEPIIATDFYWKTKYEKRFNVKL